MTSSGRVTRVRDLFDVFREGHTVYSQAAQRAKGEEDKIFFAYLGKTKEFQAQQFLAWLTQYPSEANNPLHIDGCVHNAYTYLHSILQLRPDKERMDKMESAERILLSTVQTATALMVGKAQHELADLFRGMLGAYNKVASTPVPSKPTETLNPPRKSLMGEDITENWILHTLGR